MRARSPLIVASLLGIHSSWALAIPIMPSDFTGDANIQSFESIGLNEGTITSPLIAGDVTVTTSSGFIRILDFLPGGASSSERCFGGAGVCVATGLEDLESISVTFANAIGMAGLWVGLTSDPFSATVSFYDEMSTLLGFVDVSGSGGLRFAGWRSDDAPIARILVQDTNVNSRVTVIDQVTYQSSPVPVPEPGTIALFGVGLVGMLLQRRRRLGAGALRKKTAQDNKALLVQPPRQRRY